MTMAGQSYPSKIAPTAHVSELGDTPKLVSGARAEETDVALLI